MLLITVLVRLSHKRSAQLWAKEVVQISTQLRSSCVGVCQSDTKLSMGELVGLFRFRTVLYKHELLCSVWFDNILLPSVRVH